MHRGPAGALEAVARHRPDVLLLDLTFPEGNSLEAARQGVTGYPQTKTVVLTGSEAIGPLQQALAVGVAGYLRKDERIDQMLATLQRCVRGERVVDEVLMRRMARAVREGAAPGLRLRLTVREREIVDLLRSGLSTAEMVAALGISDSTVRTHVQSILSKLRVHSRVAAVALLDVRVRGHRSSSLVRPVRWPASTTSSPWPWCIPCACGCTRSKPSSPPYKDVEIVVAHTDPRWARIAAGNGKVDVVLLGLGGDDGVEHVREMREACPGVGVVVISDSDDAEFISSVVEQLALVGYLRAELQPCGAAAGHPCPSPGRDLDATPPRQQARRGSALLGVDQAGGKTSTGCAAVCSRARGARVSRARPASPGDRSRLYLSPNTVRTHIHHVLRKLDVHSTLAAVSLLRQVPGQRRPDENERPYSSLS